MERRVHFVEIKCDALPEGTTARNCQFTVQGVYPSGRHYKRVFWADEMLLQKF